MYSFIFGTTILFNEGGHDLVLILLEFSGRRLDKRVFNADLSEQRQRKKTGNTIRWVRKKKKSSTRENGSTLCRSLKRTENDLFTFIYDFVTSVCSDFEPSSHLLF